ncbi:hypothetical protein [Belnapia moabensis]|uniref:hypothetical protein n=1 Tax=Belnapia moabensis TaxID=365533 RepID=UPI0005BA5CCE|nr:hypothetical protein [Belnapia moabensis]
MDALPEMPPARAGRYRSISLSGCAAEHLMSGLADLFDNRHLWRVGIPALISPPHGAEIALSEHPRAEQFLAREMRKDARRLLQEAECDLILLDFAEEHLVHGLRFEGCIVPDIRNAIFEPDWAGIDLSGHPLLAGAEQLYTFEGAYWEIWRESFAAFHASILAPKIAAGARVVILARRLCRSHLARGGEHGFEMPPEMEAADARLAGLYAWLAGFPGVNLIPFDQPLLASAEDVPYGGPFWFHPVRAALLRLMGEAAAARAVEAEALGGLLREGAARTQERDHAQALARQAEAERDAAREALAGEREAGLARIGELERALCQAKAAEAAEAALVTQVLGRGASWLERLMRWSGLVELARHAARRRRWARAERLYRLVLRACPGQPALWLQLGHMLKEQGAVAAAVGAYRMAERLAPGRTDAARHLAELTTLMV